MFTRGAMMAAATDFANIGPKSGPILWRDGHGAIGVLDSPDNHSPIGMAMGGGPGPDGVHLFRLTVHGQQLPGLWMVAGREFIPAP